MWCQLITKLPGDDAIESNMPLARKVATRMYYRIHGKVDLDELISVSYVGLIRACRSYDSTAGAKLSTWVVRIVHNVLIDYMREQDPLSRDHRRLVGNSMQASQQFVDEESDESGPRLSEVTSFFASPFELLLRCEMAAVLDRYPTKHEISRQVMIAYWLEELSMRDIGVRIGRVESRVSQIAAAELVKVRAFVLRRPVGGHKVAGEGAV